MTETSAFCARVVCQSDTLVADVLLSLIRSLRAETNIRSAIDVLLERQVERLEIDESEPARLAALVLEQLTMAKS